MRLPLRLHILFGVFTVLAACVAGLISPPSFRQNVEVRGTETSRPLLPAVCRVWLTVDGRTRVANGVLLKKGEILSTRVELDTVQWPDKTLWPHSYSYPEGLPCLGFANNVSLPVVAQADFPGVSRLIPLRVAAFSDEMVLYRFDPEGLVKPTAEDVRRGVPESRDIRSTQDDGKARFLLFLDGKMCPAVDKPQVSPFCCFYGTPRPDFAPGTAVLGLNGELQGILSRQGTFYPIERAVSELKVTDPPRDLK